MAKRTEKTLIINENMVSDLNETYIDKGIVTSALNTFVTTSDGNAYFRTNEPSNTFCVELPFTYIGHVSLDEKRHVVFSTNNNLSEIGIVNEGSCVYEKVVDSNCLGFNLDHPITGKFKKNEYNEDIITFSDNNNPVRRINIQNIPYKYTIDVDSDCEKKIFSDDLDCDEILLFKKITLPKIKVDLGYGGQLDNGVYSVVMAYSIDGEKYSDYYALTLPKFIYNQGGTGGSLEITIENLDRDFDSYDLVVIGTIKGVPTAKKIGTFPTSTKHIKVSSFDRPEYITVGLETLVITKKVWSKAGIISGNSEYLMLADLTSKPVENIQRQLEDVKAEYVVHQFPLEYYLNSGDNIGYWRDEVYAFYIRYLYNTGDYTVDYHLYGRKPSGDEIAVITGSDVYEVQRIDGEVKRFQAENTAGSITLTGDDFVDDTREYGYGELAYYESSELYEDNEELYGDNACTPIRLHKMPNEARVPRFSKIDGKIYINVLGIRFKGIPYPLDPEGNPVQGIVGYEIIRVSRDGGNRSVIARGIMTNARGYTETQGQRQEVLYANYPFNDLRVDTFLSENQTLYRNSRERNYRGLTKVYNDIFNFYSPHARFDLKYRMGSEFIFESQESGQVEGYFEEPHLHPKDKLITNFSLYFSLLVGAIQGFYVTSPRLNKEANFGVTATVPPETFYSETVISEDTLGNAPIFYLPANQLYNATQYVKRALQIIAKAGMFLYFSADYAATALKAIKNFSKAKQYALQYNGQAIFDTSVPIIRGQKRRKAIETPLYLSPNIQTVDGFVVNNVGRPESILVRLSSGVAAPKSIDNSRKTLTESGVKPGARVRSNATVYYATSKIKNPSQYGQIGTGMKVKTSNEVIPIRIPVDETETFNSPTVFGGDCIIAVDYVMNKMPLFTQDLVGLPANTEFDYRPYRSVAYPRYWVDFTDYELGNLVSESPSTGQLPANKHNLDGDADPTDAWTVDERYFYLSVNGAMAYIVECDANIWFREKTENPFYFRDNKNLSDIFRADRIRKSEEFKLDPSYAKLESIEFFSETIDQEFKESRNTTRDRNGLVYSLPSFKGQQIDNWQYFLPGNYFSFNNTDFGNLTGIHKLDQDRVIFLFDKSSPYISIGRDELQTTDGRKITIGDGGLFARQPRELIHTDVNYGSCQSRNAFVSTQFGSFYPSARSGRMFKFSSSLDDISRNGLSYWCKKHMPIKLLSYYPDYNLQDNLVNGVGYGISFDSDFELIFITKRDFIPHKNTIDFIEFDKETQQFLYNGIPVSVTNDNYFKDVSVTFSYNPAKEGFNSYHSWHPNGIIQTEKHFMTVKGGRIYKHNETNESFCNFYGVDYPFWIEVPVQTGKDTTILSSVEFNAESYVYKQGKNKFHLLEPSLDVALIRNSEQCSGALQLVPKPKNIYEADEYPKFNNTTGRNEVVLSKEEQVYSFNDFRDLVDDRGEFSKREVNMLIENDNGVGYIINPIALDYRKPADERKRFRHNVHSIFLSREKSSKMQVILKFITAKLKTSDR